MKLSSILLNAGLIFIGFGCLVQVSPANLTFWKLNGSAIIEEDSLRSQRGEVLAQSLESTDLNGDGQSECISLVSDSLRVTNCASVTEWQSPSDWQVKQALISDLNRDGLSEISLLVWRPFKNWQIDRFLPSGGRIDDFHDQAGNSCHLILIGWNGQDYSELWAGSALIRPVSQLKAVDLDGDGYQELIGLEGQYDGVTGGTLTAWRWRGFGFVLIDEVQEQFQEIQVISDSTQQWVIAQ